MMRVMMIMIAALLFSHPVMAQGKPMQLEVASDRVDITTGFNGANVVMFGTTLAPNPNLIVTLRGPERTIVARRKEHIFGAWVNKDSVEFRRVPSYYDYAATMDDAALIKYPAAVKGAQAGVYALGIYSEDADLDENVSDIFKDALIRSLQQEGFYPIKASPIKFLNPHFFKVSFNLPPGVPTGLYAIEVSLFNGSGIVATENKNLQVGQVGFNANVYSFADQHSFFYGVFAVLIALVSGWAAFTFLRRD